LYDFLIAPTYGSLKSVTIFSALSINFSLVVKE
jgi:hypothetical protein